MYIGGEHLSQWQYGGEAGEEVQMCKYAYGLQNGCIGSKSVCCSTVSESLC